MMPRHYAAENFLADVSGKVGDNASMMPRHYAAENDPGVFCAAGATELQ